MSVLVWAAADMERHPHPVVMFKGLLGGIEMSLARDDDGPWGVAAYWLGSSSSFALDQRAFVAAELSSDLVRVVTGACEIRIERPPSPGFDGFAEGDGLDASE